MNLKELIAFVSSLSLEEKQVLRDYLDGDVPEGREAAVQDLWARLAQHGLTPGIARATVQEALDRLEAARTIRDRVANGSVRG